MPSSLAILPDDVLEGLLHFVIGPDLSRATGLRWVNRQFHSLLAQWVRVEVDPTAPAELTRVRNILQGDTSPWKVRALYMQTVYRGGHALDIAGEQYCPKPLVAGITKTLGQWAVKKGGDLRVFHMELQVDPEFFEQILRDVVLSHGASIESMSLCLPDLYHCERAVCTGTVLADCLRELALRGKLQSLELTVPSKRLTRTAVRVVLQAIADVYREVAARGPRHLRLRIGIPASDGSDELTLLNRIHAVVTAMRPALETLDVTVSDPEYAIAVVDALCMCPTPSRLTRLSVATVWPVPTTVHCIVDPQLLWDLMRMCPDLIHLDINMDVRYLIDVPQPTVDIPPRLRTLGLTAMKLSSLPALIPSTLHELRLHKTDILTDCPAFVGPSLMPVCRRLSIDMSGHRWTTYSMDILAAAIHTVETIELIARAYDGLSNRLGALMSRAHRCHTLSIQYEDRPMRELEEFLFALTGGDSTRPLPLLQTLSVELNFCARLVDTAPLVRALGALRTPSVVNVTLRGGWDSYPSPDLPPPSTPRCAIMAHVVPLLQIHGLKHLKLYLEVHRSVAIEVPRPDSWRDHAVWSSSTVESLVINLDATAAAGDRGLNANRKRLRADTEGHGHWSLELGAAVARLPNLRRLSMTMCLPSTTRRAMTSRLRRLVKESRTAANLPALECIRIGY